MHTVAKAAARLVGAPRLRSERLRVLSPTSPPFPSYRQKALFEDRAAPGGAPWDFGPSLVPGRSSDDTDETPPPRLQHRSPQPVRFEVHSRVGDYLAVEPHAPLLDQAPGVGIGRGQADLDEEPR